jgi:hypothetical protein
MRKTLIIIGALLVCIGALTGIGQLPHPSRCFIGVLITGGVLMIWSFYLKKSEPKSNWPTDTD